MTIAEQFSKHIEDRNYTAAAYLLEGKPSAIVAVCLSMTFALGEIAATKECTKKAKERMDKLDHVVVNAITGE